MATDKAAVQLLALFMLSFQNMYSAAADAESRWRMERELASKAVETADYAGAEMHHLQELHIAESFGENDLRLENSLSEIGSFYQLVGKLASAESALARALAIRESKFRDDSIEVAFSRNNLAAIYQQEGQLENAAALQSRALSVARNLLPAGDPRLVPYLSSSGTLQRSLKSYGAAEALLSEALQICQSNGSDPRRESSLLLHLGAVHAAQEHFAQAEPLFRRALLLYDTAPGMERLRIVDVLNSLGDLLTAQEKFDAAIPLFQRALDVCKEAHASSRPCLAALSNEGSAELAVGNLAVAEEETARALTAIESAAGKTHLMTAMATNNLGKTYLAERRFKEATALFEKSRDIWKAHLGVYSPEYAASIGNIAAVHASEAKYHKAEPLDREALAINTAALGPRHSKTLASMSRLASDLSGLKRYDEAEQLFRRCIEISPNLATPVLGLASVVQAEHRGDEAVQLYRRGFQIAASGPARNTPWYASVLEEYSALMRERKEFAEAEQAATQAMGIRVQKALHPNGFRPAE